MVQAQTGGVMPAPKKHVRNGDKAHQLKILEGGRIDVLVNAYVGDLQRRWFAQLKESEAQYNMRTVRRNDGRVFISVVYRLALLEWARALESGETVDVRTLDLGLMEYDYAVMVGKLRGFTKEHTTTLEQPDYADLVMIYSRLAEAKIARIRSPRYLGTPNGSMILFYSLYRAAMKSGAGAELPRLI